MNRTDWLLEARLVPGLATEDELREYHALHARRMAEHACEVLPWEVFYAPGSLDAWTAARDWWPADCPPHLALPDLGAFVRRAVGTSYAPASPFMDVLTDAWQRACSWLAEQPGRSLEYPNETREERRRRLARAAQARHRAAKSASLPPEERASLDRLRAMHEEYMALCAERKRVDSEMAARVAFAAAGLKAARAEHDARWGRR